MRCLPLIGVALVLGACAELSGNEDGGLVMKGQSHPDKAFTEAQEHCAQYGKSAKLTNPEVSQKSDDPMVFECVGGSSRVSYDRGDR